jgi:hypothetical protein
MVERPFYLNTNAERSKIGSHQILQPETASDSPSQVDPKAPLLRTTARNAASVFSGSQIASIRICRRDAGLSGPDGRRDHFGLSEKE